MREFLKNQKGINLVSLTVTIIVLMILTSIILYNMKDNISVEKLRNLQQDIQNLRDKIDIFYANYGEIPIKTKYTNISDLENAGIISSNVDKGDFYIIDLSAIENLTLTYGQDYELITDTMTSEEVNELKDIFIINDVSHNIFYVKGIELDDVMYYTDYSSEDIDKKPVEIYYMDNVKIPDGYEYISGTKENGIIIQNKTTNEKYRWIEIENELVELPNEIVVHDENEFIENANLYKGYYQGVDDPRATIILPEENWSPAYDENGRYTDKNGDSAVIPAGFKVSRIPSMSIIDDGLVIQDEDGNEFVWVPVSKSKFETEFAREHFGTKEQKWWDGTFVSDEVSVDNLYEPKADGLEVDETASSSIQEVQKMYKSVRENGGFYIGRYEAGNEGGTFNTNTNTWDTNGKVVSKKGANVYNYIGWSNSDDMSNEIGGAVEKSRKFAEENNYETVTSTLVYGVQWDAVMKWISGDYTIKEYLKDSTGKGNYNEDANTNPWKRNITETGKLQKYKIKNIYDLGGNVSEWSMEIHNTMNEYGFNSRVTRGGTFYVDGIRTPVSDRNWEEPDSLWDCIGFRIALYLDV